MRKHAVDFICDRCGKTVTRPGKSDGNYPAGWELFDAGDLCEVDAPEYREAIEGLKRAFFGGAIIFPPLPDLTKLTPRGRKALELALDEARRMGHHHYLGTEHILLGLLAEGAGIAAGVLESQGVSLDKTRTAIEFIVGKRQSAVTEDVVADMDPETHPEADDD